MRPCQGRDRGFESRRFRLIDIVDSPSAMSISFSASARRVWWLNTSRGVNSGVAIMPSRYARLLETAYKRPVLAVQEHVRHGVPSGDAPTVPVCKVTIVDVQVGTYDVCIYTGC